MPGGIALSRREARWLALAAQRLGGPPPTGPIVRRHVGATIEALGMLLDLKADRKASALVVAGAFLECGQDSDAVAPAVAAQLDAMRRWLGLTSLAVGERGDLAPALHSAARLLSSQG